MSGFNILGWALGALQGSKKGAATTHAIDSTFDTIAPAVLATVDPAAAAILPHPAGTTATITTTSIAGESTRSEPIDVAGKVLVAIDPNATNELNALLARAVDAVEREYPYADALTGEAGAYLKGRMDAELESIGFSAPVVVSSAPQPAAATT